MPTTVAQATSRHVRRRELSRVEVGSEVLEEHRRAVASEEGEARLVGALVRALAVVAGFDGERVGDLLACPLDSALPKRAVERGARIAERDERPVRVDRDGVELRRRQATHCHSAHCEAETPSMIALTPTIAVCTRGRPPRAASARKNGKTTTPKRGRESSGQRSLGMLSGTARLRAL